MTQALEQLIAQYITSVKTAGAVYDISIPVGSSVPPEVVFKIALRTPDFKGVEHDAKTNTMTIKFERPAFQPPGARRAVAVPEVKGNHRGEDDDGMVTPEGSVSSEEGGGFTPVLYQQQQQRPRNYKTALCMYFMQNKGQCIHGKKCDFAHGERELRKY